MGIHLFGDQTIKLRGHPKALVTKDIKETLNLAWLMIQGMVISLEMMETEMGYRGSNSVNMAVKEQRVDGSWCNKRQRPHIIYT